MSSMASVFENEVKSMRRQAEYLIDQFAGAMVAPAPPAANPPKPLELRCSPYERLPRLRKVVGACARAGGCQTLVRAQA